MQVAQGDTDEERGTENVIVQEGAKALLRLAQVDQRLVVDGDTGDNRQTTIVGPGKAKGIAGGKHQSDKEKLEQADDMPIPLPEEDGRRFDADLQVVLPIDHGVHGVVGHHPADVGGKDQPGRRRYLARLRREGHRHGPAESGAEKHLRPVRMPLHEGVNDGQGDRRQ